jgi:membrane protein DedA with SNARE-associated domain
MPQRAAGRKRVAGRVGAAGDALTYRGMIERLLEHFRYPAIFALLLAGGVAVPVPEELVQLTAGFLAHEGYLRFVPAIVACWAGIVTGDFVWYAIARRHGARVVGSRAVRKVLTPRRRDWLERHFARHAFLTIVVARHTSGLRLAAFALAGTHGVRPGTFLLADGLSALLSVPLVVSAGWLFSEHLAQAKADVRRVELAILAVVALGVLAALAVRRRRRAAAAAAARASAG